MLHVNLSMPQHTRFGHALLHFWYGPKSEEMRGLVISMTGYPHNGGEHTLNVSAHPKDVIAWVELFRDEFPYVDEEIQHLLKALEGKTTGKVSLIETIRDANDTLLWQWVRCKNQFIDPDTDKAHSESEWKAGIDFDSLSMAKTEEDYIVCRKEDAPAIAEHIKKHGWH